VTQTCPKAHQTALPTHRPTATARKYNRQCGAETLRGKFPVEVVATVARICREAELVGEVDWRN
jgi:hypothetical protein